MLWQMHSQERMYMLRPFFVLSRSFNPIGNMKYDPNTLARDEWKNDEKCVDSHSNVATGFECIRYIYMQT
jgi:hypothetical protein